MKSYLDDDYDDTGKQVGERYYIHDCPFCGSKKTDLYQTRVKCEQCEACGPRVSEDKWPMAITQWNELPRKKGAELKKLIRYWSSMQRQIRLEEERARIEYKKVERNITKGEQPSRADKKWAAEREAWLHAPIRRGGM